jgi:hypothetical protein
MLMPNAQNAEKNHNIKTATVIDPLKMWQS